MAVRDRPVHVPQRQFRRARARRRKRPRPLLIDAPEEAPILAAIERTGWTPDLLLITHHHGDHVEANLALKQKFGLTIIGPKAKRRRSPASTRPSARATRSRSARDDRGASRRPATPPAMSPTCSRIRGSLFAADTLFALGCGRLLECKPPVMFDSLKRLAALPLETAVYCGHEYTQANARFALTVDPTNSALKERAAEIDAAARRRQGDAADDDRPRTLHQPVPALARPGDPQESRHGEGRRRRGVRRDPQAQGQFLRHRCSTPPRSSRRSA